MRGKRSLTLYVFGGVLGSVFSVAHNAARQKRRHNPTQIQHESSLPSSANRP